MCPTMGAAVNARSRVTARRAGQALFDPRRRRTQMRFPAAARPRVRRARTVPVQDLRDPLRQRHLGAIRPDPLIRVGHPVLLESVTAQLIGKAADVGDEPGTGMVDHQLAPGPAALQGAVRLAFRWRFATPAAAPGVPR